MKAARVVVLTVAIAAGGVAALLAGRSGNPPEVKAEAPKFNTVEFWSPNPTSREAKRSLPADALLGGLAGGHCQRQFHSQGRPAKGSRRAFRHDRARSVLSPGNRFAKQSWWMRRAPASWPRSFPSGMRAISTQISPETGAGGFILPNDRVDVILTPRGKRCEKAAVPARPFSETFASLRSIRPLKKKMARRL